MERYSFFDAVQTGSTYDRTYASADFAEYFSSFIGNGVFIGKSDSLMVQPSSGLAIKVQVGKAWINGYFYSLSEQEKTLTLARGDNRYARIDRVVCRLNMESRLIEVKVLEGTPSSNPVAKDIERNDAHYDLVLAEVAVSAGATSISAKDITDKRQDETVCGVVAGVVKQVETSALFAQFKDAFDTWFESIKGQLDGDVAGMISNKIEAVKTDVETNKQSIATVSGDVTKVQNDYTALKKTVDGHTTDITSLKSKITISSTAAPATGTPNTVYLQML